MNLNTSEVALLQPDYLGFIFYDKSPRFFKGEMPDLAPGVSKVGVFVNATIEEISEKTDKYKLDVVQLHGDETPEFCKTLSEHFRNEAIEMEIWKVFGIKESFDYKVLEAYEDVVGKFLFDTKGKEKGGNGYTFNWEVLNKYPSEKPFVLSGGIGLGEIEDLKTIFNTKLPVHTIDVNSKFETEPGLKNIDDLNEMINWLKIVNV